MFDLALTIDGDIILDDSTHDLVIVSDDALRVQEAICRIKSIQSDWFIDGIGADLEEILGMPNTSDIQSYGKSKIIEAITFDNIIGKGEVYVQCNSISVVLIEYIVYIKNIDTDTSTSIIVQLDLVEGVNVVMGA